MTTNIIYLLGAGRSGTTLLSTLMNNQESIHSVGELHHFYSYIKNRNSCSCGQLLEHCEFWSNVLDKLPTLTTHELDNIIKEQELNEKHSLIPFLLLGEKLKKSYLEKQKVIYQSIDISNNEWILDSSKYIARYLALKRIPEFNIKGIYLIRDVRGVISSFNKKVQTPKSPLSTILYYCLINSLAQLITWLDKDIVKIKYEDLVDNPQKTLDNIYNFIPDCEVNNLNINEGALYKMPHIVGGNRLKANKSISIKKDIKWFSDIPRVKQILYYLLALPLMLINRYKI